MNYIIKNMWGDACKQKVTRNLEDLRISYSLVEIGEVCLTEKIGNNTRHLFKNALSQNGYELIDDKRILLTEKIKNIIVQMVHGSEEWPATNFSVYLSNKVGYHYTYLANLFSEYLAISLKFFANRTYTSLLNNASSSGRIFRIRCRINHCCCANWETLT